MIIWRGWGILVLFITGGIAGATQMGVQAAFGDPNYCKIHHWPLGVGLLFSAVAVYFAGAYFNRPKGVYVDQNGRQVVIRPSHGLFFIPMQYWGFILALIGIASFFSKTN